MAGVRGRNEEKERKIERGGNCRCAKDLRPVE